MPPLLKMSKHQTQTHTDSQATIFAKQNPKLSGGIAIALLLVIVVLFLKFKSKLKEGFTRRGRLRKKIKAVFPPIEGGVETSVAFQMSYFRKGTLKIDVVVNCIKIKTAVGSVFNEQIARQLIEETFSEYLVSYSGPSKEHHVFKLGKKL